MADVYCILFGRECLSMKGWGGEGRGGEGSNSENCMHVNVGFFFISFCFFAEQVAGQNSFSIKYSM